MLLALETSLFEKTENTVTKDKNGIDETLKTELFDQLDAAIKKALTQTSIQDLVMKSENYNYNEGPMYFI